MLCVTLVNVPIGVPNIMVTVNGATDDDNDSVYNVMMGSNFTITCILTCPTATITWIQNDTVISTSTIMVASGGFTVEYSSNRNGDITSSVLTRTAAQLNDTSTYQCDTTVQTIQSNDTAYIFVYGK